VRFTVHIYTCMMGIIGGRKGSVGYSRYILCLTATYYSGTIYMLAGTTTSTKDMHLERECAPHAGISSFFLGILLGLLLFSPFF
jgi:hypothetical protein